MLRALFLRELRKSWLAHAALFAAVFGTATLLEYALARGGPPSPDDHLLLSSCLLAGVVISGLISGERCFSKAFKEGRYPFLLTLPRHRGSIWLAYTGGRLAGALAALPAILLARPVLLLRGLSSSWSPVEGWSILTAALTIYLVYFLGGAALAFAVRKEFLVYLTGLPLLSALLALLAFGTFYGIEQATLLKSSECLRDLSVGSLLLALVWAAIAQRSFCRREPYLWRHTAQTLVEAGLASATFAILAVIAFSSTKLAAFRDEWQPTQLPAYLNVESGTPYPADSRPVSSDGRFLFIWQQLQERPRFTRLAVVDLKTGGMTDWLERPGIHQISWSTSGAFLNVLAIEDTPFRCFGLPCEGSTSWYRLSPDLHVLSVRTFAGVGFLRQCGDGLLLVTSQSNIGRLYRLSDRDGSSQKILTSKLEDVPRAWSLDRGAVVVFPRAASLDVWWLDQEVQLLHQATMKRGSERHYYLVGLRILSYQEARAEIIRRAFPSPSTSPDIGEPLLPDTAGPLDFGHNQFFFLRSGRGSVDIWKHGSRGDWTQMLSEIQVSGFTPGDDLRHWSSVSFARVDIDFQTWTWAAAVESGRRDRLFLYDDRLARNIPNKAECDPGEKGSARLERVQGVNGLLARLTCSGYSGRQRHWFLNLVPGSGRVRNLPWHSVAVPPDLFERWIFLDPDGASVWISKAGEVWQASPGHKSRRLNPPEAS